MQRQPWFEIHDSPWFPGYFRDLVTDALESVWNANRTYHPVAGRLRAALQESGAACVVDLCSGGGGPWPALYNEVAAGWPLSVQLTDLHPHAGLAGRTSTPPASSSSGLAPVSQSIDARNVPAELTGFRTIFSSFHHFDPDDARALLADAFARREGIAVFEAAHRNARTMLLIAGVPLLAMRTAARARPVRWSRLLFTWLLPVVPTVLYIDGLLSCLRSYSLDDLRELTAGLDGPHYRWQIGEQPGQPIPIRYLIGTPLPASNSGR